MAEDSLVKPLLTSAMIKGGLELTKKLDENHWPVRASLWLYASEANQWILILASPLAKKDGPKRSYEAIQTALESIETEEGAITLSDIKVTDPEHPLLTLLRVAVRTGSDLAGIRFTKNVINGHLIEDAHIYRLSDRAPGEQAEHSG